MAFANRGVYAEKKVKAFLEEWVLASTTRDFSRMTDSKAAGRIIKAAPADYEYFNASMVGAAHGYVEVKETEHEYRLARDKVSQLPILRKREKCGCTSFVLIYHSTLKQWRAVTVKELAETGDKGSWNLTHRPLFPTCGDALRDIAHWVFS